LGADPTKIPSYDEAREKFSRDYLAENLQRTAGNVTQAARLAKRTRTDFYKLLARYRVHPDDFKNPVRRAANTRTLTRTNSPAWRRSVRLGILLSTPKRKRVLPSRLRPGNEPAQRIDEGERDVLGHEVIPRDARAGQGVQGIVAVDGVSAASAAGRGARPYRSNGAGKTTFFNLLTKFLAAHVGRYFLSGLRTLRGKIPLTLPAAASCGRFRFCAVFPHLTVLRECARGARNRHCTETALKRHAHILGEQSGAERPRKSETTARCAAGQRQRDFPA